MILNSKTTGRLKARRRAPLGATVARSVRGQRRRSGAGRREHVRRRVGPRGSGPRAGARPYPRAPHLVMSRAAWSDVVRLPLPSHLPRVDRSLSSSPLSSIPSPLPLRLDLHHGHLLRQICSSLLRAL